MDIKKGFVNYHMVYCLIRIECFFAGYLDMVLDASYKMIYNRQKVSGGFCMLIVIVMGKTAK